MTEPLTLYTHPMSRGRIARWMLEETGTTYHTEIVTFGSAMKSPRYLAINPMGKVPAIRHGDTVVTECAAICAYLADAFPEAGLAPPLAERGAYYRWLFFAAGPLEAAITDRDLGMEPNIEQQGRVGYGSIEAVLETLEVAVSAHEFIAGPHFSAADVYLGSHIGWGLQFGSLESCPAFADYWARVSDREAYRRANSLDEQAARQAANPQGA
ncbi:glutathione S-transferase family protein [Halomonas sp. MCCC 1A17488]|uniref:Glutathione S-transferase family protein n=1 Tax=Billgrantia sulfidoxydans TaxID=2733484 RepID=A0ABX7W021_9GAMM|nr:MULTISPECIES: glutathione S-transferase family protein [Halomonas]MCE8016579.1 glutathione S-transferase family protein [Halomonas sp. MCCC 1A17488]MCG3239912.1 glutathione S-transferase family protein [Halomonas sp. MCCC 1A17488]QPP50195.1 glutathione S-transferase family protein [Halomonas sp. SS10-MC5]QTP53814.1 glutathione S-transferase family protein [Halomonas sulfidoxydans]